MKVFFAAVVALVVILGVVGCGGGSGDSGGGSHANPYKGLAYAGKSLTLSATQTADLTIKVNASTVTGTLKISNLPSAITIGPHAGITTGSFQGLGSFTGDSPAFRMAFSDLLNCDVSGNFPPPPSTEGGNFTISIGDKTYGPFTFHSPSGNPGKYSIDLIVPFQGGDYTKATAINDSGTVVGAGSTTGSFTHAFVWTRTTGTRDLGTLGGDDSGAVDINNAGTIVGEFTPKDTPYLDHGFVGTLGALKDIGFPKGYTNMFMCGITDSGKVLGMANVPNSSGKPNETTWAYSNDTFNEFGPEAESELIAFNHAGLVYGDVYDPVKIKKHWKWSGAGATTPMEESLWQNIGGFNKIPGSLLGPAGEILASRLDTRTAAIFPAGGGSINLGVGGVVMAMNSKGEAVTLSGYYWTLTGGLKSLNSMIDPASGFTILQGLGINNKGQIICQANSDQYHTSLGVTLVLTPPADR
ncbi:MAG TPA: hypothetical protein VG944_14065 [Fimbriimonas sp.]|nr:hypothetical protein [Fimbriimonas sp.]